MRICIDRCLCHGRTFGEIKKIAREAGDTTLETLQRRGVCGAGCGRCHPYVKRMLRTGETEFQELVGGDW
ncbi:MAG: (2Fe-2S)-binding protein [Rhodothermales bacterium]|nr:(2Fe-2S)-binding protein [Rhodothermales bacterium]